jgi:hypothetical protein
MTNQYVKYEDFVISSFKVNQWKPCGLPTDRPTDISKTIYSLEGGHTNQRNNYAGIHIYYSHNKDKKNKQNKIAFEKNAMPPHGSNFIAVH